MAATELRDYIENGNITHSVNYPDCAMPRSGAMRVAMIHKNVPNIVSGVTTLISSRGANITNMTNRSRGEYACTLLDLDEVLNGTLYQELSSIEGVIRVRLLK